MFTDCVDKVRLTPSEKAYIAAHLADDTDMARGGILTNDCKPVKNAKGE